MTITKIMESVETDHAKIDADGASLADGLLYFAHGLVRDERLSAADAGFGQWKRSES